MDINPPLSAAVDITNNILILRGFDRDRNPTEARIPVGQSDEFIGWLLSVFQYSSNTPDKQTAILVDSFDAGLHREEDGQEKLSFSFKSQTLNITLAMPLIGTSPDRIAAIQRHLQGLFSELSSIDGQNRH